MAPREKGVSNTNKNTMYILVAALVIIIVIVGVGAYVFLGGGGVTPPSDGNGGETVYTMGNATSLQFSVNLTTSGGSTGIYKFAGKNLGTANITLRVDATPEVSVDTTYSYIMFASNQTSWNNETGTWAVGNFTQDWGISWSPLWSGYIAHNSDWKTGDVDITYTDDQGNSVVIYNIAINPTLDDSVFSPM